MKRAKHKGKFIKAGKLARMQKQADAWRKKAETEVSDENSDVSSTRTNTGNNICDWRKGRRIVDLSYMADQMTSCRVCSKPLNLHRIQREHRVGYASILYIDCECGMTNPVSTNTSHRPSDKSNRGMPVYDINTKAVLGKCFSSDCYC